ncbi:hypothetical protein AVEN_195930-1 [Araneus ventricosus]|uniref:Gustatory receptor n=1 Tax=Araneus ventricosus TaxID=182803 RepID=A0A4Y2WPI2_ARAVE|nr:hypothetical protein AVEN_195930-1 [Araneus ventricosus]
MHTYGYGMLWNVLALFGIKANSNSEQTKCKIIKLSSGLKSPIFFLYVASAFYSIPMLIHAIIDIHLELRTILPLLTTCSLSYVLWYVAYKRCQLHRHVARKLNDFLLKNHCESFNRSKLLNSIMVTEFLLQLIYVSLLVYCLNLEPEKIDTVWTFGFEMEFSFWGNVARFLQGSVYTFQVLTFPGFVSLFMSGMYLHCRDSLISYGRRLKRFPKPEMHLPYIMEYSIMIEIVREFEDVLSTPAFILVSLNFLLMFNNVATFFLLDDTALHLPFLLENGVCLIFSAYSVLSMSLIASETCIQAQKLSKCFENLYEEEMARPKPLLRNLSIIKAMTDKEIPVMSACSVVYFTRSFILSVFGGFFTYALLFINIKN